MLSKIVHFIHAGIIRKFIAHYENNYFRSKVGYIDKSAYICNVKTCIAPHKIYMYENSTLYQGATFVMNPNSEKGIFVIKKWSSIAENLTVITNNHSSHPALGVFFKKDSITHKLDIDEDVVIEEDVWIGQNVTLLPGVNVGRGSIVGAGSVVRGNLPPYSISLGNPAKVVGFKFTPEQIIEHEKQLYLEQDRLPEDLLVKNHQKYFINKMKEIRSFASTTL